MPWKDRNSPAARKSLRAAQQRYYRTDKGHAAEKRRDEKDIASGSNAASCRSFRVRHGAYLEKLFHPAVDKRVHVSGVKRMVVLSDLQIPFEDPEAVEQALRVIDTVRPDTVVLDGDVVDCYRESAFLKDFRLAETVTFEQHRRARAFMAQLEHIPRKVWMGGNHEERWWRTIKIMRETGTTNTVVDNLLACAALDAKELKLDDPVQSFRRVFGLEPYGFAYYPYSHRLYVAEDNLVVTHGKYVSRHSGYTAKRSYEWLGRSCIVGHTHRMGTYFATSDGREHGAWENGCLCQMEPEYDDAPNWQQGLSVVEVSGPYFRVVPVKIVRKTPKSPPVALYTG